jgi:hypothetical protein
LIQIQYIDEVMRGLAPLIQAKLAGTDIQVPINLNGIGTYNFSPEMPGKAQG